MNKKIITLVDYQSTSNYVLSDEEKHLQRLKKSIIYIQNKYNGRDVARKTRKNYTNYILALGRYLKNNGHTVYYVSLPDDTELYAGYLKHSDYVYFWSTTPIIDTVKKYIVSAKCEYPQIKTILAGYHATGLPGQIMNEVKELDYVSIGENEYAVNRLLNGDNDRAVPGIAYRNGDNVDINLVPRVLCSEEIPAPDYSLLNGDKKRYRYYLQMTRSCIFRCRYCVYGYFGGKVRTRTVDSIRQELCELKEIMGDTFEMHIFDNIIAVDIDMLRNLRIIIKELDMHISFSADIRPEYVTKEVLYELEKLNVRQLFIGFEDANEHCRAVAGRKMSKETLTYALKLLKKYPSIKADCYWMLGLPGTSNKTFRENIDFIKELISEQLLENICTDTIFVPLPGTPLYDNAEEYGISNLDTNWANYRRSNYWPVFELTTISKEDMHRGLLEFDRALIEEQLKLLRMTEDEVLEEYFNSDEGNNVEAFLL